MSHAPIAVFIYTYKAGLLSRVAHDLKLQAEVVRGEYDQEGELVSVSIGADSLRVVCAMRGTQEDHGALSVAHHAEIESIIRTHVLDARRYPWIRFEVKGRMGTQVSGTLHLQGRARSLTARRTDHAGGWHATARLDQRDFDIPPFSAAMGTLRVQPEVEVRVFAEDVESVSRMGASTLGTAG